MALSGCVGFKGMPSLEMKLPEAFQQQPAAQTPIKLQKDWWKHTNDKTLLTIIHAIETQNLSLEQARFRLNAARLDTQKFDYLPSLTAEKEAQYDRLLEGNAAIRNNVNAQPGGKKTTGYYDAKLDVSWEAPIYGQLGDAENIANANIAIAEADIDAIRASAISEAIRLYADMRRLQQESAQREAILTSAQRIVEYQNIKHKAGLITDSELATSYQSLLTARNEMQRAESEAVARMQQLAKLSGSTRPDEVWTPAADIPSFDVPAFDDTPLDVLRNRPDIRKAEASVLVAAGELELSKSDMYPKLTLLGNLSQLGNLTGNPLMGTTVQLTSVPSLSLPLFDWRKRLSAARIMDEKLSEKASVYRETVIGAMNELEEFWSSYRTAQAVEESTRENTQIAYKASAHAGFLFKQGINDAIAAETAAIDAASAAIAELQAKADTITRLTALTKALGGASATTTNE
jgi:outer membrane protein TolC